MAVDWTQLPPEMLQSICRSLRIYSDYIHFRAVCRTWRSSTPKTPHHLPPQLPCLMLPHSHPNQSRRAFYDLSAKKFHFLNLPEASHRKRLCGSSHGWIVILDDSPTIVLLNPLTRAKLHLPPVSSFPNVFSFNYSDVGREYALLPNELADRPSHRLSLRHMRDCFIKKVVLSSCPSKESDFIAVAILNLTGELAYCRNGDQSWSIIQNAPSFCEDVIFFGGLFYAVNKAGQIAACDVVGGGSPNVSFIQTTPQIGGDMQYLVGSGNQLLLVSRYLDLDLESEPELQLLQFLQYKTTSFQVFKLDWIGLRWEKVKSLGDKMLFLGENSSLSLSALDFPGCVGDCIYFTDDNLETNNYDGYVGEYDIGVFKLQDGSIEKLPCHPRIFHSRPLWISFNPF